MSEKLIIERNRPLTWLLFLLLPELAPAYVLAGMFLLLAGKDWGFALIGAAFVTMVAFEVFDR